MKRFSKAWAAFAFGAGVMLASGLITGNTAVWISTAIAAVTATVGVASAPANKPKEK